jgi:hypothetical protein
MQEPGNEDLIPVMLTITIKNRDDFTDAYNHLRQSFTKLLKKANNWKMRKNKPELVPEFVKVIGAVYSFEFKIGKGGQWHPHLHMFAMVEDYIDQPKLSSEWFEITCDSFVVGVTECKNGILSGLIEVLKYSTKFSDMTPAQTVEVFEKTQRRALVSPLGILRQVPLGDFDSDEQLDGDFIDYVAHYLYRKNGYKLKLKADVHDDVKEEASRRLAEEKAVLTIDKQR